MTANVTPDWVRKLPVDKMSQKAFDSLLAYDSSLPTGTFVGKVWKRNLNWRGDEPVWIICEYVNHPDPKLVGIEYRRPEIVP